MDLKTKPISKNLLPFWREMYTDPRVRRQMYLLPDLDDEKLFAYLHQPNKTETFVVFLGNNPVGGFTISKESQTTRIGQCGAVVHRKYRGTGLGQKIQELIEKTAKNMGLVTLRVDVYSDNTPAIKVLERAGFRPFIWLEKNLV